MPATHEIDDGNKLIITNWHGKLTAGELIEALINYQHEIKSREKFIS